MDAPAGRSLADFDAGDDQPDLADLTGIIQPRAPRKTPPDPAPRSADAATSGGEPQKQADTVAPVEEPDKKASPRKPAARDEARRRPGRPRKSQASTGGRRSTTFQLTSDLKTKMEIAGPQRGLSTGDLIVAAIEATADQVVDAIAKEGGFAGGNRFAARRTHQAALERRKTSLVNARLLEADFAIVDEIVTETGARSRNHLVETALRLYLADQ